MRKCFAKLNAATHRRGCSFELHFHEQNRKLGKMADTNTLPSWPYVIKHTIKFIYHYQSNKTCNHSNHQTEI